MRRSKFSDEQILAVVEGEAGRRVTDVCRAHGITGADLLPLEIEVWLPRAERAFRRSDALTKGSTSTVSCAQPSTTGTCRPSYD